MGNQLAAVTDRVNVLLVRLERGDYPERARLEDTLTDGYACALSLDAECERIERHLAEHAAELTGETADEHAQELSAQARLLADRRKELNSLRALLGLLRAGVQEARVA